MSDRAGSPGGVLSAADGGDLCIGCVRAGRESPRKATTRGNCDACYRSLYDAIRAGKLTNERAIAERLWLPRGKRGRKATVAMTQLIDQLNGGPNDRAAK